MTSPPAREVEPYERLARHYDHLMDYIDYEEWVELLIQALTPFSPGKKWLDISCGTGSMAIILARRGYDLTAVDLSPAMVARAREKTLAVGLQMRLEQGDMRSWHNAVGFDVVLNVHDGLNYLLDTTDVLQFMQNTHTLLNSSGILLCDVATPLLCQRHFRGYHEMFSDEAGSYERITGYDPHNRVAQTSINLYSDNGEAELEVHRQRAYDLSEIMAICQSGPFDTWKILDSDSLEEADQESERLLLILSRGAA